MGDCRKCKGTGKQTYLHNYWEDWKNPEKFLNRRIQKEAVAIEGPCHYCTDFKWMVLNEGDVVIFFDNAPEVKAYCEAHPDAILINQPRSFEEKGD